MLMKTDEAQDVCHETCEFAGDSHRADARARPAISKWTDRSEVCNQETCPDSTFATNRAVARPTSSGASSGRQCAPGTATSCLLGHARQNARCAPIKNPPGSPLENSVGRGVPGSH